MDSIFFLQLSFFFSFLGMAFIFVRNLPLVAEYKVKYISKEKRFTFRLRKNISDSKIKTIHKTHKIQERIGHRLRIFILKIDNILFNWLKNVKEKRFHIENIYFRKPEEGIKESLKKRSIKLKIKRKKRG
jgi:hypothetical protein